MIAVLLIVVAIQAAAIVALLVERTRRSRADATNSSLGSEKFGIGPSVVALTQPGPWTIGILFNQIWSVSGANDRADVNSTFPQLFANYNLGGGLSVGVSSEAPATGRQTRHGPRRSSLT